MKYIKAVKYIDAVSRKSPYKYPRPIFLMVALYKCTGYFSPNGFERYLFFRRDIDEFRGFMRLSKAEKKKRYLLYDKQLTYCIKLLKEITIQCEAEEKAAKAAKAKQ